MRRWLSNLFIASYLGALGWGIVSHALKFFVFAHPAMYFFVWDMFCGWQAYESRYHIVGEAESGNLYELAPGPWGAFCPFGDLPRNHYDALGHAYHRMALNTLKHTDHEPMRRIIVVEECWPKKYNLPEHLWALRMDEPKDPQSYFWLRASFSPDGEVLHWGPEFVQWAQGLTIVNNPRLLDDVRRGRPFYAISPQIRDTGMPLRDPTAWAPGDNSFRAFAN